MDRPSRFPAIFAYLIPVIGWLYVFFFERKNELAIYHLKQSIGLVLFLAGTLIGWGIVNWLLFWIPYMDLLGISLFTLVIAAYIYGIAAWILGMINASNNRMTPLPLFGVWANRLPIR